jgi:hypothetical protein
MSADKLITLFGILAKTEASYNAGGSPSASTDGILLSEPADLAINYAHDGARGRANGTGGTLKRGAQSGRSGETTLKVEGRGRGAAYSASILPEINALMRASGHGATVVTTGGSESVTYAPVSDRASFVSAVLEAYARGQKYPLTGVYADLSFSIDGPGFLMFEFALSGIVGIPTDVAVPTITYQSTIPPKADAITYTLGSWSPIVKSLSFKANRKRSPRARLNTPGHKGWSMGGRAPELEIVVEAVALSTFDPYTAREAGTSYASALVVGATQYNRFKHNAPVVQITNVEDDADEETALWKLTLALAPSSPTANDDYTAIFD